MGCPCKLCSWHEEYKKMIELVPAEAKEFFEAMSNAVLEVESERDYYKAIVENKWPDSDSIISRYRTDTSEWISTEDKLPADETPVIAFLKGMPVIAEIRWERPGWEDSYEPFQYWDNPQNDGQDWEWTDITHWMPLPLPPKSVSVHRCF